LKVRGRRVSYLAANVVAVVSRRALCPVVSG
jgi:hypothetical protein